MSCFCRCYEILLADDSMLISEVNNSEVLLFPNKLIVSHYSNSIIMVFIWLQTKVFM